MIDRLLQACEGKKHLIFDFDQTIFRIHPDWINIRNRVSGALSKINPRLVYHPLTNNTRWETVTDMTKEYGKEVHTIVKKNRKEQEKVSVDKSQKNTSLINFIASNQKDYQMHIWSSNHTETFMPYLRKFNLLGCFSTLVGMDTVELIKQYPDGFYHIHSIHGGEKKEYLMIGNSIKRDGGAAEAAGIDYFFIDSKKVDWIEITSK